MATTYSLRDLGITPGQSVSVELELELAPYVQGEIEYAVPDGKVPAQLAVTEMTDGTSFWLRFQAEFEGPCARCLEPASQRFSIDMHDVHDEKAKGEDADQLRSEHVDDQLHELNVTSMAQEAIALKFPTRVVCRTDCRGLCGQCGVNLNEHPDHAHEKPQDSRWDALKDLTFGEGESSS
ncbi:MAG: DUF177 domain-containing protein [Gaiellales bacterium]